MTVGARQLGFEKNGVGTARNQSTADVVEEIVKMPRLPFKLEAFRPKPKTESENKEQQLAEMNAAGTIADGPSVDAEALA